MAVESPGSRGGFVLLEAIIALTILAMTAGTVLRSFSQSFSAARRLEVRTQAQFLAQQLLDEFEIDPPVQGASEVRGFGDDYWEYTYVVDVEYEYPDYDEANVHEDIGNFFPLRIITIDIYYDNGRNKAFRPVASLTSGIMGFERFSQTSKRQFQIF